MYQAERDLYCYPDSDVLKNKAGLTTPEALEQFETAMTFARSEEPLPRGRFSVRHYRAIQPPPLPGRLRLGRQFPDGAHGQGHERLLLSRANRR